MLKRKVVEDGAVPTSLDKLKIPGGITDLLPEESSSIELFQESNKPVESNGKWQECPGVDFKDEMILPNKHVQEKPRKGGLDISAAELRELQNKDETLACVREALDSGSPEKATRYVRKEGLIMCCRTPRNHVSDGEEVLQLVLSNQCQEAVLRLAHEIPLSGHLGKKKTVERVLQRFYWPTLHRDVAEWCRTCPACQKTSWASRYSKAPLIPLPIVEEPFPPYSNGHHRPSPSKQIRQHVYSGCV